LQISGTSIAGGGATAIGTADIRSGGLLNAANGSQSFTFQIGKDNQSPFSVTAVVTGNASGISAEEAVGQLNDALNTHGIHASVSDDGYLQFNGDVAFVASSGTATGTAVATASTTISNTSQYVQNSDSWAADATEALTFSVGNQQVSVTPGAGATTRALAAAAINDQTKALGIYAFDDGTNIVFQSASEFKVSATTGSALAGGVFDDAAVDHTATRTATGTATSGAEAAITALSNAVTRLGTLQGTVGTAQNKLQYAVQLAQSQISNFSAAESRIRDADVAAEAANLTKAQVLQQASLAAMAQANSAPQAVLSLLRG
jgi:flagellin